MNRDDAGTARVVVDRLLPDAAVRRQVLALLATAIEAAHAVSGAAWSVTLTPERLRLNVGTGAALTVDTEGLHLVVTKATLSASAQRNLKRRGYLAENSGYRALPLVVAVSLPPGQLKEWLPRLEAAHVQAIQTAAQARQQTSWYHAHATGVVAYLREALHRDVPAPSYVTDLRQFEQQPEAAPISARATIERWLVAHGLHFTSWQIAAFTTALQTKGFVILSGISGTGKTRLAQSIATLLSPPIVSNAATPAALSVTMEPPMLRYGRIPLPTAATRLLGPAQADGAVVVSYDGRNQRCRLTPATGTGPVLALTGAARQWLQRHLAPGATLLLEPELDADHDLINFRLFAHAGPATSPDQSPPERRSLFLPVRPDWRDSKSLLGYYNPLTATYEWTPLLRFLLRALDSYRAGDGQAWFVILDEMNLARVEYYFADLLSALESGRDERGTTREAILLPYPATAEGELPPQELHLPPNLYIIGTVNADETTHAFSPRVLDRAFTLEFDAADFANYPAAVPKADIAPGPDERRALLASFTGHGKFAVVNKGTIADHVTSHPDVRLHLQALNEALRPHQFHFGYRVFDEIIAFLAAAANNGTFFDVADGDAEVTAFDAAVLMKILPRFYGSTGRLEAPLLALLAWCLNPATPDTATIAAVTDRVDSGPRVQHLRELAYRFPHTAGHAMRMLQALYVEGFAVFGG